MANSLDINKQNPVDICTARITLSQARQAFCIPCVQVVGRLSPTGSGIGNQHCQTHTHKLK